MRFRPSGRVALLSCSAALAGGLSLAAQAPAAGGSQTPPPPSTGLIVGQVIDASSGRPVAGAIVAIQGGGRPGAAAMTSPEAELRMIEVGLAARGGGPAGPPPVMTGSDGRFVFRDLAKGNYGLTAIVPGYTPGTYGRRRPEGPGRQVELADNERVTDLVVRVWKYASISGTVVDEAGEPAVGMSVRAMRRVNAGGRRRWNINTTATTDDRGIYRLPNLVPGEYLVLLPATSTTVPVANVDAYYRAIMSGSTAELTRMRMESQAPIPTGAGLRVGDLQLQTSGAARVHAGPAPSTDGRLFIYPTVFYPTASRADQASVLTIGSGEQRMTVDFQLKLTPTSRVSGSIAGPDGPAANTGVRLLPAGADDFATDSGAEVAVTSSDAEGRFTFLGVPPGQYIARAYRVPRPELNFIESGTFVGGVPVGAPPAPPTSMAGPTYFAEVPVSVGDSDLSGVNLVFRPGARVSGHVVFDGTAPAPPAQRLQQLIVTLGGVDSRSFVPSTSAARLTPDGQFTTAGYAPGRYTFNLGAPGPEWTLRSVMVNGVNILERPLELGTDDITGAVVTFTDRVTELSGTVTGDAALTDGATVIVFPADYQTWIANGLSTRRTVSTVASKTGTYSLRVPLPGNYLVAAIGADTPPDQDPEFYAALAKFATRISFSEGDKGSLPLTLGRIR
jgi:protocatechuate 3,4-dioxygenase beta subunit